MDSKIVAYYKSKIKECEQALAGHTKGIRCNRREVEHRRRRLEAELAALKAKERQHDEL